MFHVKHQETLAESFNKNREFLPNGGNEKWIVQFVKCFT